MLWVVTMSCDIIKIPCTTRGTDVSLSVAISDDAGAFDLTGRSVSVFDVHPTIDGLVSADITDAENGIITVTVEGTAPIDAGVYSFRVQVNNPAGGGPESIGLPMFRLEVR